MKISAIASIAIIFITASVSSCKNDAQKQQEELNLDSLKTLTIMGSPAFAQTIDSLSKAYNTENQYLIDSAKAEVAALEKLLEADTVEQARRDALMWALNKRDLVYYADLSFGKIRTIHTKFIDLYLKYLSEDDVSKEILKDNEGDFLYFTAKPVDPEKDPYANQEYENIIFNIFKANVYLKNYNQALGYNQQMTYLVKQRYGTQTFKYARCLSDGAVVLNYMGKKALAKQKIKEADAILAKLQKEAAANPNAEIPADSIAAIRQRNRTLL